MHSSDHPHELCKQTSQCPHGANDSIRAEGDFAACRSRSRHPADVRQHTGALADHVGWRTLQVELRRWREGPPKRRSQHTAKVRCPRPPPTAPEIASLNLPERSFEIDGKLLYCLQSAVRMKCQTRASRASNLADRATSEEQRHHLLDHVAASML